MLYCKPVLENRPPFKNFMEKYMADPPDRSESDYSDAYGMCGRICENTGVYALSGQGEDSAGRRKVFILRREKIYHGQTDSR